MAIFGDTLRQARAYKGVTLKEAELATRVNRHHLAALEDENFSVLPPPIYQRGIVRNYATYLDLDAGKLLAMFDEARGAESETDVVVAIRPLDMPNHWAPNFAIIAFMVVMSAIVFAWAYSAYFAPAGALSTASPPIPTVTAVPSPQLTLPTSTSVPPTSTPAPEATDTATATETAVPTATTAADQAEPTPVPTVPQVTVSEQQPAPAAEEPYQPPADDSHVGGIMITAQGDVYVEVVADGVTVFASWLGSGQVTQFFWGSSFQVSTSNGGLTLFTNDCGDPPFYMGTGTSEIYQLNPQPC